MKLFIAILVATAYLNIWGGQFVFDDKYHILSSKASFADQIDVAKVRAVPMASIWASTQLFGQELWAWHGVSLAIHIACAIMLFCVARRLMLLAGATKTSSDLTSFAAACLWGIHPMTTEAVTFISQNRFEGLCFLSALCAANLMLAGRLKWSFAFVAIGLFCKQWFLVVPFLLVAMDWAFRRHDIERRTGYHTATCVASMALAIWIAFALVDPPKQAAAWGFASTKINTLAYWGNQPEIIGKYVTTALWPTELSIDHGWRHYQWSPLAASVFLILVGFSFAAAARWPKRLFPVAAFWILLTPIMVMPISDVYAEHRFYAPLAMLCVMLCLIGYRALQCFDSVDRVPIALGVVFPICAAMVCLTIFRSADYHSRVQLWESAVQISPNHWRAQQNLGAALMADERYDEARTAFYRSLTRWPSNKYAQGGLGLAMAKAGDVDGGREWIKKAVRYKYTPASEITP